MPEMGGREDTFIMCPTGIQCGAVAHTFLALYRSRDSLGVVIQQNRSGPPDQAMSSRGRTPTEGRCWPTCLLPTATVSNHHTLGG